MLEFGRFEHGVCDGCGHHEAMTNDLNNHYLPTTKVCNVCKAMAQFYRRQAAEDEQAVKALGEKPDPIAPRPMDGRRTFARYTGTVEQWRASRS